MARRYCIDPWGGGDSADDGDEQTGQREPGVSTRSASVLSVHQSPASTPGGRPKRTRSEWHDDDDDDFRRQATAAGNQRVPAKRRKTRCRNVTIHFPANPFSVEGLLQEELHYLLRQPISKLYAWQVFVRSEYASGFLQAIHPDERQNNNPRFLCGVADVLKTFQQQQRQQ